MEDARLKEVADRLSALIVEELKKIPIEERKERLRNFELALKRISRRGTYA